MVTNTQMKEREKAVKHEPIGVKSNSQLILPNVGISHNTYQLMKENERLIDNKGSFFRRKR